MRKPNPATSDPQAWAELVQRAASGEPTAVDRWYREEHPGVYRLCFGFLASEAEAEDAAQDAMLHLLDNLEGWDASRPWQPWRTSVVLNLCRDRVRRLRALRHAEDQAGELRDPAVPDASALLEGQELQELLRRSLVSLSPREREVFVLRDLEDVPVAEVAQLLGIGESSVRSLGSLARRRLRTVLGRAGCGASGAPGATGGGDD